MEARKAHALVLCIVLYASAAVAEDGPDCQWEWGQAPLLRECSVHPITSPWSRLGRYDGYQTVRFSFHLSLTLWQRDCSAEDCCAFDHEVYACPYVVDRQYTRMAGPGYVWSNCGVMVLYTGSTNTSVRDECQTRLAGPNSWVLVTATDEDVPPLPHVQECPEGYTQL